MTEERNIEAHIAGLTATRIRFSSKISIAISGIYRAKGNEAPMVYVVGAEYCHEGSDLIRRRNILFTAVTRSRGWVRVCGVGESMKKLQEEWDRVVNNNFQLSFTVPTPEELQTMRKIHRDRTRDEMQRIEKSRESLNQIVEMFEQNILAPEDLPPTIREKLSNIFSDKS